MHMNNYLRKNTGSFAKCYTSGSTLIHMTKKHCIHQCFHDNRLSYAWADKIHCSIYKRIGDSCFALYFLHFVWQIISHKGAWADPGIHTYIWDGSNSIWQSEFCRSWLPVFFENWMGWRMRNVTCTALWFFKHKADVNLHQLSFKQQKNRKLPPRSSACLFPHSTGELLKENKIHQKLKY